MFEVTPLRDWITDTADCRLTPNASQDMLSGGRP